MLGRCKAGALMRAVTLRAPGAVGALMCSFAEASGVTGQAAAGASGTGASEASSGGEMQWFSRWLVWAVLVAGSQTTAAMGEGGLFEGHSDVGNVTPAGTDIFSPASGSYILTAAGANTWYHVDDFHYAWKKSSGDMTLTADISFAPHTYAHDPSPHRKGILMFRQTLDPGGIYVGVAQHGSGMMALQFRRQRGVNSEDIEVNVDSPRTVRIDKRGDIFTVYVSMKGEPLQPLGASIALHLDEPFYVGLGAVSHDVDTIDKVEFTHVDLRRQWFTVTDPEANAIEFVQPPGVLPDIAVNPLSGHIIHVGFIVHDRALEDELFRAVLGFRPYWFGGMRDDTPAWISQQVPEGTDWLEYMIVGSPGGRGIPATMSLSGLGMLNHFSLGVASTEVAYTQLWNGNRLAGQSNTPKIGRDAKWQLNLLDPDGTRAEIMEFHAIGTPCCSAFTATDPHR